MPFSRTSSNASAVADYFGMSFARLAWAFLSDGTNIADPHQQSNPCENL